jgi:hypothetical protein
MHIRYAGKTTAPWLRHCMYELAAAGPALAFLLAITPARAQEVDPRETQARADCLAGRYQAGVDLLAQLFAETGKANYIYNQGRCYEQNGKFDEAILRFREFSRKAKDLSSDERAEVNSHIAECQAMKAEQDSRAVPAAPPTPPAEAQAATSAAPAVPEKPMTAGTPSPAAVVETPPSQLSGDGRGAGLRTAGIVTGSIGVAALVAGVIFSIETRSLSNDVTADDASRGFSRTTYDHGQLFGDLQWVGYGVGAAALACGGVLYYLGYQGARSPTSDTVSFLPVLLPGGTGAVLQGRF